MVQREVKSATSEFLLGEGEHRICTIASFIELMHIGLRTMVTGIVEWVVILYALVWPHL